jgi:hypothetical protein
MANKQAVYTFGGVNQDTTKSKHRPEYYFEGQHIKILATDSQSTGSVTNEVGNARVITLPDILITTASSIIEYGIYDTDTASIPDPTTLNYTSGNEIDTQVTNGDLPTLSRAQTIIGHIETREGVVLWTTDGSGFDCIWHIPNILDGGYTLELLYVRNFGFSTAYPIQAIFNYENKNIQKVYWVDGFHQIRNLNLTHNEIEDNIPLIDIPISTINLVGTIAFSQPKITSVISGGTHTAGVIQYGYNLFRLNGSQTKIAPLSELVALDKGLNQGGGDLNEVVSSTPVVKIDNIDTSYTNIKVYAIKYTSLNALPSVNLISEQVVTGTSITVYDNGSVIEPLSLDEFLFLGSNPLVPQHIESKDSRLFLSNIQDNAFEMPKELDTRAYGFPEAGERTKVWKNPQLNAAGELAYNRNFTYVDSTQDFVLDSKHPAINMMYEDQRYQAVSSIEGGEGKYIKYRLNTKEASDLQNDPEEYKFFKDNELHRVGIQFYNNLGQISPPKWIADFRAGSGNLNGFYNTLEVTLKPEFYTWLNDYEFDTEADRPIGYKVIRADRTTADRTIICQGALTQYMVQTTRKKEDFNFWSSENEREKESNIISKIPIPVSRGFTSSLNPLNRTKHLKRMNEDSDYGQDTNENPNEEIYSSYIYEDSSKDKRQQSWQYTKLFQMHSPEVLFKLGVNLSSSMKLRIKGLVKNTKNDISWKRVATTSEVIIKQVATRNTTDFMIQDDISFLGLFGPSKGNASMDFQLINREYLEFISNTQAPAEVIPTIQWVINPFNIPTGEQVTVNYKDSSGLPKVVTANTAGNIYICAREVTYIDIVSDIFTGPFTSGTFSGANASVSSTVATCTTLGNKAVSFPIYNVPEITERGQGVKSYANDGHLDYSNTLEGFLTDKSDDGDEDAITDMNSWGSRCITIAEGNKDTDTEDRKGLEDMYNESNLNDPDGLLLGEICLPDVDVAIGNIYGGNSYEDLSRTNYIEIGDYSDIQTDVIQIDSPGDTYVYDFTFIRINKKDTEVLNDQTLQLTERVVFPVETTVDLKNRNDQSKNDWESNFQPSFEEFTKYNTVYSQSPNLISNNSVDFNFRRVKEFDTRIQSTKLKIPNESVDSWTDILENELLDLDGKFGAINNIIAYKDTMYAFQDSAIAAISINPRVQVQGSDGVGLELGTGGILYDFNYLTTTSGSINKWGVTAAKKGIYYYDALNKAVGRIPDAVSTFLSDAKGLHSFFNNNYDYSLIETDNPLLERGALLGYDNFNNDVYITLLQDDASFTRCYNELREEFVDLKTYKPTRYINKGEKLLIPNPTNNQLWEHYSGETNSFFEEKQISYIVLQLNPESNLTTVFDNIFFNSQISINDIDQPELTLTHIQAYNEFQDSGNIPLIVGRNSNLRRRFRNWRADIPRKGRERMRNPWIYLKLELDQETNQKLILHDIILNYTV